MNHARRSRLPRSGFTIVELMVSMALIIFVMYVLAEAFAAGSKAFRDLKAVADLNTRLRTANNLLRRYLAADHFEGRKRLSDPDFWLEGPPKEGFFRIWQGSAPQYPPGHPLRNPTDPPFNPLAPYVCEGIDLDGNSSFCARDHHLHFTVRLRGNQRGDFFQVKVPGGSPLLGIAFPDTRYQEADSFASQWAEVAVYMKPTGEVTEDPTNPNGLPLHTVFLRQRLLVPSREAVESIGVVPNGSANLYPEVSQVAGPTNLDFNSPGDITMPGTRFGVETLPPNDLTIRYGGNVDPVNYPILGGDLAGSDLLLSDVLSFEIKVLVNESAYGTNPHRFVSLHDPLITPMVMPRNPAYGANGRVFDTWSSRKDDRFDYSAWKTPNDRQTIPLYSTNENTIEPIRIRAIQITFRIWDEKTKQSRQVSLIQDM